MTLAELRKRAGLSQDTVAKELKVSVAAVSLWEGGGNMPRAERLARLAEMYGCTIDEIVAAISREENAG